MRWIDIENMSPSRKGTTRRNEARERNTTRLSDPSVGTSLGSSTRCSPKSVSTELALKRGIPKPRSVRDRSLKRNYGGPKSHPTKSNSKNYEQSTYMGLIRLKFPAGCSDSPNVSNSTMFSGRTVKQVEQVSRDSDPFGWIFHTAYRLKN